MGHAESSAAIICNLFGEKDEQQVITEAIVPQPVRFDPSKQPPLPGESAEEHARWLGVWRRMDLAHINGFPLWEQAASPPPPDLAHVRRNSRAGVRAKLLLGERLLRAPPQVARLRALAREPVGRDAARAPPRATSWPSPRAVAPPPQQGRRGGEAHRRREEPEAVDQVRHGGQCDPVARDLHPVHEEYEVTSSQYMASDQAPIRHAASLATAAVRASRARASASGTRWPDPAPPSTTRR